MQNLLKNDYLIQIVTITQYTGICALIIFVIIGTCIKKYFRERNNWINTMRKIKSFKQIHKNSEDLEDFENV